MALISISGVALPTPSSLEVGIYDVQKAERNALGNMIIEKVTTKRKLELSYQFLTASQMKIILDALEPTFYDVTYVDPKVNGFRTSSFYCSDRNLGMIDYKNGVPRYKNLSFSLIER